MNKRSTRTNVTNNDHVEQEANNEDFNYEILNNNSSNILDKDNVLSEADLLSKNNLMSESDLSSEDNILNKENFNREIVDEPLSSEEMLSITREFVSYLSNIAEVLISSFNEFIGPFVLKIKLLEKEKVIDIQGNKSLVFASLGNITSNLPQGGQ
ncbi:23253_t:CDS:2 [Racocetra persica]|uniref:23253_t:CDS:1 n=1 Tax=Racocetra persica TaxID=160502 RepID=A0ACA9M4P0_9GLOM|nr:23253_t:CDS:2 [Racocetra persica]